MLVELLIDQAAGNLCSFSFKRAQSIFWGSAPKQVVLRRLSCRHNVNRDEVVFVR
jgi:hypothetical protein